MSPVIPLRNRQTDLERLAAEWLAEYANTRTRETYANGLSRVIAGTSATTPNDLTAAAIGNWASAQQLANNTMRAYLNSARQFLTWCDDNGHVLHHRDAPLKRLMKSFPPTYGKVQAARPANRLDEAGYRALLVACSDGTEAGLRDELVVRLAVTGGMRASEVLGLTVGSLRSAPNLAWIGKANRPRTAIAGSTLVTLIRRYLDSYSGALGQPPADHLPAICPSSRYRHTGTLAWGSRLGTRSGLERMLARRAAAAGLAPIAPHDLKRTTGRMLHEARSSDGGHLFDLLDIADVLDHSNPKVTKDCYIGPLGNANKERAADLFD